MRPARRAANIEHRLGRRRSHVAADARLHHGGRDRYPTQHRVLPLLAEGPELEQVAREHDRGIGEACPRRVARMPLVAPRNQVDHHQPALRHRKLEIGGLPHQRRIHGADRREGIGHRGVLRLLAKAQDHEQAAMRRPPAFGDIAQGTEHRRDRGLGITRTATIETTLLDHRRPRITRPPLTRRHHIDVRHERQRRARLPRAHLDLHSSRVADHVEPPPAHHGLDEARDGFLVATHGGNGDEFVQQGNLSRRGRRQGRSPSPSGPRSWCPVPPR